MKKTLIFLLLLISFVFIGASCGNEYKEVIKDEESLPFQGKQKIAQTDNKIKDVAPRVSGDGETIVFWRDTEGINGFCLGIDDSNRVFFARTTPDYKWNLTVADADGALESGQSLGIRIKCPNSISGLSVTKNGRRISGTLESGEVFVANDQGEIIAQRRSFNFSMITGDGLRLLALETKMDLKDDQRGLIYYDIDNNLEQEGQVLDMSYKIYSQNIDASYSGGVVAAETYDEEGHDSDVVVITWKKQ